MCSPTQLSHGSHQLPRTGSLFLARVFSIILPRRWDCLPSPCKSMFFFSPSTSLPFSAYTSSHPLTLGGLDAFHSLLPQMSALFPAETSHWTGAALSLSSLSLECAFGSFSITCRSLHSVISRVSLCKTSSQHRTKCFIPMWLLAMITSLAH